MEKFDIMRDIAERTGGDIYLGVVGPVRTGKSTFIKRFMELLVLPNIVEFHERERAQDELPQSGGGRTIMTTEPKFIPSEAVEISIREGLDMRVRLVDCVGYAVPGAVGFEEEEGPRMVHTPWFDDEIPFQEAAEIGTRKVITDHSTIGIVVLTDGSVTEIPRENYLEAEERVILELKELNKPFVIVLNSIHPYAPETIELAESLSERYNVSVIPVNAYSMEHEDIMQVLQQSLYEFPVTEVNINLPLWIEELDSAHWLRSQCEDSVKNAVSNVRKLRDIDLALEELSQPEIIDTVQLSLMDLGTGVANIEITMQDGLFHRILEEVSGTSIEGDHTLLRLLREYSHANREWKKVSYAVEEARMGGYGVVTPSLAEMTLEEPELIKQGGRFGVKLKASAPSFHLIRANIYTEITPLIGSEKQCEELMRYILEEFEDNPQKIWETNIFGKSLHELVQEGIQGKLYRMPENAQVKFQETLQRIANEGGGGLICIIL
ncbi:stage IV sporulation protein A [Dehalobacterium formicoaceticum]|uniref:Stage IV sporulation protein A n=1 Tax=Dehalobacterium formicoaceticum TaxID=51515 RepID=A0ABT1Y4S1_9FIRM|nr:stage IV sporulation protein A [Dehalobacterium formicoaceticum]MCR6545883.1 stage IV sporulation protein A [Dehalobacterium formicoaceticum]